MGARKKSIVALIGGVVLAILTVVALRHGWADIVAFQGRAFLNSPDKNRSAGSTDQWSIAQAHLEQALALDARNPALREDMGRLLESRSRASSADGVKALLEQSLSYLRMSLGIRPTSPYTWANLAFVKSRLGTLDAEFYLSVENAAFLGPWEPEVQLLLADIGFRYWDRMPRKTRDIVHAAIGRGLKRQDEKLFDLALRYGRVDVMCATPGVFRTRRAIRCI